MIAALAFAGCSSEEDDPINKGDENTDDGYGYVAVNIVEPKSIGSRAKVAINLRMARMQRTVRKPVFSVSTIKPVQQCITTRSQSL